MAVTQTGSTTQYTIGNANTGTVSTTITVPADAEFVVVGITHYSSTVSTILSNGSMTFTKGGVDTAMTSATTDGDSTTSAMMVAMYYMALPDTGSNKTLKWDWAGAGTLSQASGLVSVTFWKGVDTASPIRSVSGTQSTALPYVTATLTAVSGDLVIAYAGAFYTGPTEGSVATWSSLTSLSQLTGVAFAGNSSCDGAWATTSPSGNLAVGASTSSLWEDGGIIAIVVKAGASGDTFANICQRFYI